MPFVEVECPQNIALYKEIKVEGKYGRIRLGGILMEYFPSKTLTLYIDKENKKIGLKDGGRITIRDSTNGSHKAISVSGIKKYNIKTKRYPANWSDKHKMVIAEIEFDE